jgi:signal transduction histidine kinase
MLEAKHHILVLDLPTQPVQLEADVVRLAQVLSNLLINAAKYTDPGGQIQLRAHQEPGTVVVSVVDNGIGISAELLPRVFTMFFQSHQALGRAEGGLGVGLSLVRGLVMLHGASVQARSEGIGRGSEFTVKLPTEAPLPERLDVELDAESFAADVGIHRTASARAGENLPSAHPAAGHRASGHRRLQARRAGPRHSLGGVARYS